MATRLPFHFIFRLTTALVLLASSMEAIEFVNVACDKDVQENAKCGAGGVFNGAGALSGTFVCRKRWGGFFFNGYESTCAPTVLGQVIGYENDKCGCCNGECQPACTCLCDTEEDKVLVMKKQVLFGEAYECVTRSKAGRLVADGSNNYVCVPDAACPAVLPPDVEGNPTKITQQEAETAKNPEALVEDISLQDAAKQPDSPQIAKRRVEPGQ